MRRGWTIVGFALVIAACSRDAGSRAPAFEDARAFLALVAGSGAACQGLSPGTLDGILQRFSSLPDGCYQGARLECVHQGFEIRGSLSCDARACTLELQRDRTTPGSPELYSVTLRARRHRDGIEPGLLCF